MDDTPPVTLVTGWKALDDTRMEIHGVTVDDGGVGAVKLNGESATLVPGPMNSWTHILPLRGDRLEVTAVAEDIAGNREMNPHHLALIRTESGWSRVQLPFSKVEEPAKPAVTTVHPPLEVREAKVNPKELPWPLWDGTESVAAYASRTRLEPTRTIQVGGVDLQLQLVPAGSFLMGSREEGDADEKPLHRVVLSQPFYLGKFEVTQRQYQAVMGRNPSSFQGPDRPVEQVSWFDAEAFLKTAGNQLRLPTEAEWEFACRAGTASAYANGETPADLSEMGWWGRSVEGPVGNSGPETSEVGLRKPNLFGLHDMHGNVYEWCADYYAPDAYAKATAKDPKGPDSGDERVLRGGAWETDAAHCRSANRNGFSPASKGYLLGFRVAAPVGERAH
ncbi:MAG: SUMF1/EgtB/PvdO family nonheme iron enzyme [Luteolibacter sp.]